MKSILYSQNFLKSSELVNHLLDKTSINVQDTVYEIGPGKGIITKELAKRAKKVIAFEKDKELYSYLIEKFKNSNNIEIHFGDFLEENINFKNHKIFSNIPFNITAEIIKKIVDREKAPQEAHLFLQKEAAQKYLGEPKESLVSLSIKPWFELKNTYAFEPTDFNPIPSVDVVLFEIKKREEFLVKQENSKLYLDFLHYCFSQYKPNVEKTFEKIFTYEQIKRLSKNLAFNGKSKITELKFEQFVELFNYFSLEVSDEKQKLVFGYKEAMKKQQGKLEKIHRTRTDKDWKKKT